MSRDVRSPSAFGEPLVCQLSGGGWFLIGMWWLVGMGISLTAVFNPSAITAGAWPELPAVIALMFLLPVAWGSWAMARCAVIADARGLTFVGQLSRRLVKWKEVEDYWLSSSANSRSSRAVTSELQVGGKTRAISPSFDGQAELRARIEHCAHAAKSRHFERRELRADSNWPKTFAYHDVSGWTLLTFYFIFTFALLALTFAPALLEDYDGLLRRLDAFSLLQKFGLAAITFALCGSMGLVVLARYPAVLRKRGWLHRSVVGTPETLTFRGSETEATFRFDEITDYYLESLPGHLQEDLCVIEVGKKRFEFLSGIADSKTLLLLVEERAINAGAKRWRRTVAHDNEILGGERSLWRGGIVGSGAKVHHYRTRLNRIGLIFGGLLALAMWAPILTGRFQSGVWNAPQTEDWALAIVLSLSLGAPTLWGVCGWFFSAIETDESGVTQRAIWGNRVVRWDEIEQWGAKGMCWFVRGKEATIRYGLVADSEGLLAELRRRAPDAELAELKANAD